MELHQLRYVIAVVDAGTFTAGAELVRVSQSGVSTQIAKLERELGLALFERTSRRVELTDAGRRLVPLMRRVIGVASVITTEAAALRGLVTGSLRLGVVTGLAWDAFVDALATMHERHPGVDVRLIEGVSSDLAAAVRAGELDVAVAGWAGSAPEALTSRIVIDDALCVVVAPGHAWASRSHVKTREIARADVIALPAGTGARVALDAAAARAGLAIEPRWEVSTPAYAATLARRGLGVALLSATTAALQPDVVAVPLADAEARSVLGVLSRPEPSPAASAFLALLEID
ncbi:LysR family transcriptional regulator [uncultured Microbacterium sp.]|uniref:LysR family transcriptional regulator n=1 Tax=uncultured Microbacterium sp. TaxID=191216 RepID=UPI0025F78386|nr:LysR family transcriptional regulator [uncultured Microbacterium sp.]